MESYLDYFSGIHPLSETFVQEMKRQMKRLSLPKNFLLLEAPRVSDQIFFLETGFAMSYTYVKGKKRVDHFWKGGHLIVSPESFFDQVPSGEFIELMDQSEVWHISHGSMNKLMNTYEEARVINQYIVNLYYTETRNRIHLAQQLSASDRYMLLTKTFPGIELLIPQKYIASYLCIATQSLSRIKKRQQR